MKAKILLQSGMVDFGSMVEYMLFTFLVLVGREGRKVIFRKVNVGGGTSRHRDDLITCNAGVLYWGGEAL